MFAVFEFSGNQAAAYYFHSFIVPLITVIYLFFVKRKSTLFLWFLIAYSLSDILGIVIDNISLENSNLFDFEYYFGNGLYILAYIFLVIKIGKSLSFNHVLKHFKLHLVVLSVLNIYLLYVLQNIISPNLVLDSDFYLELVYNLVIILLLSVALLNYFYRDNRKSLYLFLGALCIVFSEVMDIAYIYITQRCLLNFLGTTLALCAFYFFYQQSKLLNLASEEEAYLITEK
jgi:hypothetical protein